MYSKTFSIDTLRLSRLLSALLTMLNSCASGITVVDMNNGFGAAVTAILINRKIEANK